VFRFAFDFFDFFILYTDALRPWHKCTQSSPLGRDQLMRPPHPLPARPSKNKTKEIRYIGPRAWTPRPTLGPSPFLPRLRAANPLLSSPVLARPFPTLALCPSTWVLDPPSSLSSSSPAVCPPLPPISADLRRRCFAFLQFM
jgi:hypothetical protein